MGTTTTTGSHGDGPHSEGGPGAREAAVAARTTVRKVFRSLIGFAAVLAALWMLFEWLYVALPYTRPGADIIYAAKQRAIRQPQRLFAPGARVRLIVMGNSKVLAGFVPDRFDRLAGPAVSSFNAGLPGDDRFTGALEAALQRSADDAPTHVLLTMPWDATAPAQRRRPQQQMQGFGGLADDDAVIADRLLPFRHLPRDLILFALRARARGGLRAYYDQGRRSAADMRTQRGYYFIEGQSHFPNQRLPDDFRLDSDTPTIPYRREADAASPEFARLCALLTRHHVRAWYVPLYQRPGQYASPPPPDENEAWSRALRGCEALGAIGPDYWLMPNRLFADPIHLNPEGAADYTRRLAELVVPLLGGGDSGSGGAGGA